MTNGVTTSTMIAALRARLRVLRGMRREDGWVLVIALAVMTVMLGFGAAILSVAGTQARVGGTERQRDAAFSLADAGLNTGMFALAQNFPLGMPSAYPAGGCTDQSTAPCPSASFIQGLINSPDTSKHLTWRIDVYDNGWVNPQMQSFYSDANAAGEPHYDANGDGKVWVRVQVTVGTVTKAVVALVQTQPTIIPVPYAAVVAGGLSTSNNGNKVIINTAGTASTAGAVDIRCATCLSYRAVQISPDTTNTAYSGGSSLSATTQASLIAEAKAAGTYYATCPAALPSQAKVIWIDSGTCSYTGNGSVDAASPGLMVLNSATLTLGGTIVFNGLIYALNNPNPNSNQTVITFGGNAVVTGAVMIDGLGQLVAGSSGQSTTANIYFSAGALNTVQTTSNVDYIQSTWRQL